ncbi:MAG: 4Fe-4S binding protein [Candidatus Omnitrophica bacterium]|nr:4Fe-4S binding protein [Candidatus Omnitrophota bacterium]
MKRHAALLLFLAFLYAPWVLAEQRFPPPDFESGYSQPTLTFQEVHRPAREYLDAIFLVSAMGMVAWLLHYRRSRKGIFLIGIASLLYFGFYKEGCVCPIGAIQNVSLGLVGSEFVVPIAVMIVFLAPLIFALIWGRVFCGGVCPLGAIQDLFIFKPIRVPLWLEKPLGLLRYFYLGLAVYFAIAFQRFIICEYDPFVSLFRMSGPFWRFMLGASFLLLGLVIARPYCRYLCPYGALLSLFSRWSSHEVRITPTECINCTLCDATCPFEAIHRPTKPSKVSTGRRWAFVLAGIVVMFLLTLSGYFALGKTIAGAALGLWFGILIGGSLIQLVRPKKRETFETDRGECLSCGRCYQWCPSERAEWEGEESHAH